MYRLNRSDCSKKRFVDIIIIGWVLCMRLTWPRQIEIHIWKYASIDIFGGRRLWWHGINNSRLFMWVLLNITAFGWVNVFDVKWWAHQVERNFAYSRVCRTLFGILGSCGMSSEKIRRSSVTHVADNKRMIRTDINMTCDTDDGFMAIRN